MLLIHRVSYVAYRIYIEFDVKKLQWLLIFGLGQWWTKCNLVFLPILALEVFPLHVHSCVVSAGTELRVRSVLQVVLKTCSTNNYHDSVVRSEV